MRYQNPKPRQARPVNAYNEHDTASNGFRDMMDTAANQLGTGEYIPKKYLSN